MFRCGLVISGLAWYGLTISALSPSGLSAGFSGIQLRRGMVRRSALAHGELGQRMASCGAARAADSSTELLRRLPAALIKGAVFVWHGMAN